MSATQRQPSTITTGLVVVSAIFPALSLASIVLRYVSRRGIKRGWQADDWWIIATWAITLGISIDVWCFIDKIGIDHVKGTTVAEIRQSNRYSATCVWSLTLIMQAALATVKISILLFYKRVFSTPKFIWAAWAGIAVCGAWGAACILLHTFQSDPVSSNWTGGGRFTLNSPMLSIARAGSSLALDIVILLYPLPKIMKLHVTPARKVGISLIFALGAFCCIAAAVRLDLVKKTVSIGAGSKAAGFTRISRVSKTLIWCIIEPNCSIIAASLPCYGTLLRGRAPESLVRSVRSVLSLASGRGSNNSGRSQRSNGSRPYNGAGATVGSARAGKVKDPTAITESEIELADMSSASHASGEHERGWENYPGGETSVHVDVGDKNSATGSGKKIEITRTYETTADTRV